LHPALEGGTGVGVGELLKLVEHQALIGQPQIPEAAAGRVLSEEADRLATEIRVLPAPPLRHIAGAEGEQPAQAIDCRPGHGLCQTAADTIGLGGEEIAEDTEAAALQGKRPVSRLRRLVPASMAGVRRSWRSGGRRSW
jgi:hypothetical protein